MVQGRCDCPMGCPPTNEWSGAELPRAGLSADQRVVRRGAIPCGAVLDGSLCGLRSVLCVVRFWLHCA